MYFQVGLIDKNDIEYYAKFQDVKEWYFSIQNIPNHCYRNQTFNNLKEAKELIDLSRKYNKKIFFVANEISSSNYSYTKQIINKLFDLGIDGVILRDPSFIEEFSLKRKKYVILSSLSNCFNLETLKYYSKLNVKRIALPEQVNSEEAISIINNKFGIEVEIFFILREYCNILNSHCYIHDIEKRCICRENFKIKEKKINISFNLEKRISLIYDIFTNTKVKIIKIGRQPNKTYAKVMLRELIQLKEIFKNAKLLSKEQFKKNIIEIMNLFDKIYDTVKLKG